MSEKVALITGASRGIGQAIAFSFGAKGLTVVGTATTQQGADNITESFNKQGVKGRGLLLDVTSQSSIDTFIAELQKEYGMPSILVNNAAVTRDNLLLRMKEEEWEEVISTNLTSIYRLTKICLRDMLKARWGRIISIGSVVGTTGNPGQVNYATAKAGLVGFTKSLAQEVGSRGITVNAIAPGIIDTDMTKELSEDHRNALLQRVPLQRLGAPNDVAAAAVFLASEDAGYITGQTLHVNGGMCMV